MNVKISYLDNIIPITEDKVTTIEIENKGCFYRTIRNFIQISNGEIVEEIYFFDTQKEEIKVFNTIMVISDYFNLELIMKKYSSHLNKLIIENIDEKEMNEFVLIHKKFITKSKKLFENIDFPILLNDEFRLEQLVKILKPQIPLKNTLIENLYLIIDLEKTFNLNKLLVFTNLKQYLDKRELLEFYKYCIYNGIRILIVENNSYQLALKNEQKLIIDDDLDEFMI